MNHLIALQEQLELAQTELDKVLAQGENTFTARKKLKTAQLSLQEERQKIHDEEAEQSKMRTAKHRKTAIKIIKDAESQLGEEIGRHVSLQTPLVNLPLYLAENLVRAHEAREVDLKAAAEHRSRMQELENRFNEIQAERARIIQRRTTGDCNDEQDGATLALLQADMEGLHQLVNRESAKAPSDTSGNMVSQAQAALDFAIRMERVRCLHDLVMRYESLLIETAKTLAATPGITIKQRYQPCPVLRQAAQSGIL